MFVAILWITACNKDDCQDNDQLTVDKSSKTTDDSIRHNNDMSLLFKCYGDTKISEDEVFEIANSAHSLFGSSLSKNGKRIADFKKMNYRTILSKSAKTADSIPVYFINYEKTGFVIVAGDRRLPQILAYAPEGTYEDDGQSGYTIFMKRLPAFVQYVVDSIQSEYEMKKDSLYDILANNGSASDSIGNDVSLGKGYLRPTYTPARDPNERYLEMQRILYKSYTSPKYEHFLPTKWHQGSPFNNRAPICSGIEHMPAGCVVTAVGQIVAYHRYPSKLGGYSFNWSKILEDSCGQSDTAGVARLCYELGKLVKIQYGCDGSSSNIYNAYDAFRRMGYTADNVKDYDEQSIINSLGNGCPVYIKGSYGDDGHAWVIDGVYVVNHETHRMVSVMGAYGPKKTYPEICIDRWPYIHCNYGHSSQKPIYVYSSTFTETLNGDFYYWNKCKMITNIKR